MTQDNITPEELVKELRDCDDDCMECPIAVREVSCLALETAADLIEQQAAKIKALEAKVPRWIPVTERLRELAEADKEGRVVVLPCKVGDTAYRLQYIEETPGWYVVGVTEMKFSLEWVADVGKTIFATREEAELALKEVYDG